MSEDRLEGIERIINMRQYLTPVSRDNKDIQSVMDTETVEFQELWNALCDCFNNVYVKYMMQYGLSQWESIYKLHPHADETYADRRKRILAAFAGTRPYTLRKFREMLDTIYGKGTLTPIVDGNKYLFNMQINWDFDSRLDNLHEFVEEIVPKNLLILYTYFFIPWDDALDGLDIRGGDLNAFVSAGMRDVVPYGNVLTYPKADGTYKAGGMFSADGTWKADGEHRVGDIIKPGALKLQEGIDWQFIPDGRATADGAYTACGDLKANGERPWILQYNSFMDTFSAIIITMKRPDGTTELEDDVAAVLTAGEGIKANGEARAGKTTLPIDNSGRLTIERAHKADGKLKADGGDINLTNGSILADGSFKADGGGNHARYELYVDDLEGKFSLVKPKKHTPLAWTMPELFDETTVDDGEESATAELNTFDDDAGKAGAPFTASGLVKADGGASASAGNLLPFDTGGVLTIIRVLTANGTRKADGGLGSMPTFDGSLKADGKTTAKGGETIGARRHYETL